MKNQRRQIGVGGTFISNTAKKYVNQVLDSNRLSYGPFTQKFEAEFARLHDRKYALFCNSGTSALQVGLHALKEKYGWKDGAEVLVPAITFIASSNVILQNNLKPVFVEIDPDYYEMDPEKIESKITKKTVAMMPVHLFGQPCDMDPIMKIAKKHKLKVIEDSCETMFVSYKGKPTGSWGDVACFSTYVAHLIVTGVGGLTLTNDNDLAVLIKSLYNHGRDSIYISIDDDKTKDKKKLFSIVERRFSFVHVGYSYRGTEMEGALGVAMLQTKDAMLKKRQKNAQLLTRGLKKYEQYLQLPKIRPETEHAFMMYPLVVKKDAPFSREDLIFFLEEVGIETRNLMPLLSQPIYKKLFGNIEKDYPVARWVDRNGFYIGCHQEITSADVRFMLDRFDQFFQKLNR
jgi:perosamine synthetase